ncbi:RraA family protein [bacterium]|nr:RraA family protein [bacterium]
MDYNNMIMEPNKAGELSLCEVRQFPSPYKLNIDDMCERYSKLYTGAVIDIFQEMNLHNQWLGPDVKCLTKWMTNDEPALAGFAFTIQWISDPCPEERGMMGAKMVGSYPKNSIVVVDCGNDHKSGFWGELATTTCIKNGVRGAVINGGAKDVGFVRKLGFPIYAKYSSCVDGFHYSRIRGWNLPIWWGDVLIRPMDFLLGDTDGVLVIPQEIAEEVMIRTEARSKGEDETRALLEAGIHPTEASIRTGRKDL